MEAGSLVRLARSPLLVVNLYTHNEYGERRDNCSYTDVAKAGGSSGMSRLESQMSQMFEEMKPHARHRISGCRREKKCKHEAGLKRATLNEHMEPQVPVGKTSAAGQGIRRPGHPSPGVRQECREFLDAPQKRGNLSCNVSFIRKRSICREHVLGCNGGFGQFNTLDTECA